MWPPGCRRSVGVISRALARHDERLLMNHHISSVLVAVLLGCTATALPADVALAQHPHDPGASMSTTNLPGPCFMGGLWDESVAGPPPTCFRQLDPGRDH